MKRIRVESVYNFLVFVIGTMISGILSILIVMRMGKLWPGTPMRVILSSTFLPMLFSSFIAAALYIMFSLGSERARYQRKISLYASFTRSISYNFYFAVVWALWLLLARNDITNSRYFLVFFLVINILLISVLLGIVERWAVTTFYKGRMATLCGIVTTTGRVKDIVKAMKKDWTRKIVGIALIDVDIHDPSSPFYGTDSICGFPVAADKDDYLNWVRSSALDEIFIYVDSGQLYELTEDMLEIESMGARILTGLPMLEAFNDHLMEMEGEPGAPSVNREVRYLQDIPMLSLTPDQPRLRHRVMKRIMDIIGGLVGCLITLIFMATVGVKIVRESPGGMFFKQDRVGKNGRIFKMYKFRSMYQDAEERKKDLMDQNEVDGLMFKMTDDPRITPTGKFIRRTSIDEFPQFFNVLKGDMSLVGTRPPTVDEYKQYSSYHKRRLSMKPGITGLWQVSGRSDITDFEEVVRLDCEYIDNWDMGMDIKILFKTIGVLFSHEGAK